MWNDTLEAPIASDGSAVLVGHIASRDQAERWQAAGYDIAEAVDRFDALLTEWRAAANAELADDVVASFYEEEASRLRSVGIPESDPDYFRVYSAPKNFEWD